MSLPIPFNFSAIILVLLYWIDILTLKKFDVPKLLLKRMRIPFYILATYFISAEIILTVTRTIVWQLWAAILDVVNVLMALTVVVVTIAIVLNIIRKSQDAGLSEKLIRLRRILIAMLVTTIVSSGVSIFFAVNVTNYALFNYAYGLAMLLMSTLSMLLVSMFKTRRSERTPQVVQATPYSTKNNKSINRDQSTANTNNTSSHNLVDDNESTSSQSSSAEGGA
jgi:hypothetical protein